MSLALPDGFKLGASTAAYQIEGAWDADGKGESIWDRFTHTPGCVHGGDTGDIACDHYRRFETDLDLAGDMGLGVYRFSVSWPRLFPEGTGTRNQPGFDFYSRLVDACLARGIEPWPCLYHWDLPQALEDRGGWSNRAVAGWFADYADAALRTLGDRVPCVALLNEPGIFTALGYMAGMHAPGVRDVARYGAAAHHSGLASAAAFHAVRAAAPSVRIGTVVAINPAVPATDRPEDVAAAAVADAALNQMFADGLLLGSYPQAMAPLLAPHVEAGDMAALRVPLDWLGINHYTRMRVRAGGGVEPFRLARTPAELPQTAMGWEIRAEGIAEVLHAAAARWPGVPLWITENGMASESGRDDADRIAFLRDYLGAVLGAHAAGVDVRGYLVWSLTDNFEWAEGYAKRFGLIEVDYATQARTPRASARWLAGVTATRRLA